MCNDDERDHEEEEFNAHILDDEREDADHTYSGGPWYL